MDGENWNYRQRHGGRFDGGVLKPFVTRGLTLSGSPAELAALLRDCAASPHRVVRDYGRSLERLAGD